MTDALAFYAAHGAITDPGEYAHMFDGAPDAAADPVKGWPKGVETDFTVGPA